MANILLLVALIVLVIPWPIKKTIKKIYPLLLIALLIIIASSLLHKGEVVYIKALDEKNANSEGSEVWLKDIVIDGEHNNPQELLKDSKKWAPDDEGKSCLVWRNYDQPAGMDKTLSIDVQDRSSIKLVFESNKWRGKVQVSYNDFEEVIDCYADTEERDTSICSVDIDLAQYSVTNGGKLLEIIHNKQWLFVGFGILFLLFIISYFYSRKKKMHDSNSMYESREIWMDVLKILSGFMVVLIHTTGNVYQNSPLGTGSWYAALFVNTLTRFSVPCFFMISGILALRKYEDIKTVLTKRLPRLVLSLVFWSIIYIIANSYISGNMDNLGYEILTIPFERKNGHLWYIYQIVGLYLFSPVIYKAYHAVSRNVRLYFVMLTLIIPSFIDMIGRLLQIESMQIMPSWELYLSLPYIGLAVLGRILYDELPKMKYLGGIGLVGSICALAAGMFLSGAVSRATGASYMDYFGELRFPSILLGVFVFIFFYSFKRRLGDIGLRAKKIIVKVSSVSLGIYMIHVLFIMAVGDISLFGVSFSSGNGSVLQVVLGACLYYVLSLVCCLMMSEIPVIKKVVK